jgi:hypothetical protein
MRVGRLCQEGTLISRWEEVLFALAKESLEF